MGHILADELNKHGRLTKYSTTYSGGSRVYTLIHATYDTFINEGRKPDADNVASAFINANGNPAWDK